MSYYLYKLQFTTPLHVGDSRLANGLESVQLNICADTLFSALCHTVLQLEGREALSAFVEKVRTNRILFSDTLPYKRDTLFIPKPFMNSRSEREVDASLKKLIKKLTYIPVEMIHSFMDSINGKEDFDIQSIDNDFAKGALDTKVNLTEEISRPYAVASVGFNDGCGLYGIVKAEESDMDYLIRLFKLLGLGGIGGKTSSGYGKFRLVESLCLDDAPADSVYGTLLTLLANSESDYNISLTTSLPLDSELEQAVNGANYKLVRRGGFVYSTAMDKPLKKQTQYCFSAGSVFKSRFEGGVFNVGVNSPHPVYRYLKPIFIGVRG